MAAPAEQVKLGFGPFGVFKLEDSNKPKWDPPSNPTQVPDGYQTRDDRVIDSYKAAEKYGGVLVVDYRTRDQSIDCYEAAKKYGGILVVDYPIRDRTTTTEKYGGQLMKYPTTKVPPRMPLT